jgi:hypothetical protein
MGEPLPKTVYLPPVKPLTTIDALADECKALRAALEEMARRAHGDSSVINNESIPALQDGVDEKRRVFTAEPTPPYDVGDLWTDGSTVKQCSTAKAEGAAYDVADWTVTATNTSADGVTIEDTDGEFSVKAGGIGTDQLADEAVTHPKLAPAVLHAFASDRYYTAGPYIKSSAPQIPVATSLVTLGGIIELAFHVAIQIVDGAGSRTMGIQLQHSPDNVNWTDIMWGGTFEFEVGGSTDTPFSFTFTHSYAAGTQYYRVLLTSALVSDVIRCYDAYLQAKEIPLR